MGTTSHAMPARNLASSPLAWLGVVLLVIGLCGHLFAAHAIGGYYIAYRDHIFGFFLILAVTGGVIALLGWRYWRGRRDLMLLVIGAVQAAMGIWIWTMRFGVH